MTSHRILIVEDDERIAELLRDYLVNANYHVSMLTTGNGVIYEVRKNLPDAILLDLMLPGKDGLTICKEIRTFSRVPILMLTAKVEEIDRLIGLEVGADDYICKPFSPKEVVARIKAVLRRSIPETRFIAGPITINLDSHLVQVEGSDLRLTRNEFDLLKILVSRPGYVFTRSDLISKIQGFDFEGYDRAIDSHIKNLRKKLEDIVPGREIIKTVYGIGYSLSEDLS